MCLLLTIPSWMTHRESHPRQDILLFLQLPKLKGGTKEPLGDAGMCTTDGIQKGTDSSGTTTCDVYRIQTLFTLVHIPASNFLQY
ncbi:Hypp7685 [Branchiostoma lanceolatum]|uniref:Hypp7685 protein n=1 Tax=Branchiostoma lanceolatum TaxID=7740 RepID=A0A8J9Z316_BRALA|nr:Hypp7685 [Branchiostoma lanceolatum]